MKFCSKCGTQIPDESNVCPQCQNPTDNSNPQIFPSTFAKETHSNKKLNKFNVVLVIILIINILLSATNTYFIVFDGNASGKSNDSINVSSSNTIKECPASEYGNHIWEPASCQEPAQCEECGTYKDDALGSHYWYNYEDGRACMDCGLLYEDYFDSQE